VGESKKANTDFNIRVAKLEKNQALTVEHQKRIAELSSEFEKFRTGRKTQEAADKKFDVLEAAIAETRHSIQDVGVKLRQSFGIQKELSSAPVQLKALSARIEAMGKELELAKKDQVSMADLKALEKRIMETMMQALKKAMLQAKEA
jgi:ribosomal protein S15P/S13E